jgi:uncharacterized damage-inducible protein DinB
MIPGDQQKRNEIGSLVAQLKDAYEGDPWFGRSVKALLREVEEEAAFIKINSQHSILELVWHMITWREFTIHCLQPSSGRSLKDFEEQDWRTLDHTNVSLWKEGLQKLEKTQSELLRLFSEQEDSILEQNVPGRTYNFRKLLTGIIQHDIYHLGQIAYITKQVKNNV